MTLSIYLVGCGKSKRAHRARAMDLYTGSLFRATRKYVESVWDGSWWVLSAKHGLVNCHAPLEPYDATLTASRRAWWADRVRRQLELDVDISRRTKNARIVIFAGERYAGPLRENFELNFPHVPVEEPLAGLGLGARLHWLKTHTKAG